MAPSPNRFRIRAWAVIAWLSVWQIASWTLDSSLLLPAPLEVVERFFQVAATIEFWQRVGFTLLRIAVGFAMGIAGGALLAGFAMRFPRTGEFFAPAMALAKSVPVACFVVLALIWAGASELSVVVTVLVVAPIAYENVCDGVRATDVRLLEMARVLRVFRLRKISAIYLPQVMPYFRAACASGLGMAWKAGVAAEIIAIPAGSMGEALYGAKIHFDTVDLLAWTLAVVCLSVAFEKAFAWVLERASTRALSARKGDSRNCGAFRKPACEKDGAFSGDGGAFCVASGSSGASVSLEFRSAGKAFGGMAAFSDVSFRVHSGEIVCLMAPSGFGKTTLLRMAAGLETPDEGDVVLSAKGDAPRASMAFQEERLIEHADALANARLALRPGDAAWSEAPALLHALGVEGCIGRAARTCSGGQRRRIALARALLTPHDILLLDEPFAGLDDAARIAAARIVREHEAGRIVVVATHDESDARNLGARVVHLASLRE